MLQPRGTYRWDADDYARHSQGQLGWARELIAKLALRGDERLLDVGCGDGKVSAEMSGMLWRGSVLGIDNSADMVALAQRSFPRADHANLRFVAGDARSLTFDDQFDVVFSNAVLHWVRDHRPVLAGIGRSLVPGGRLLLQMGGRGNAADVVATVEELMRRWQWSPWFEDFGFPYGFHGPEQYRAWLSEAGLVADRAELIPRDMVHAGRDGLAGWLRTTWLPYTSRLPEDRREHFVAALTDAYLARLPLDSEGRAHVAMVRLEVAAHRPRADD